MDQDLHGCGFLLELCEQKIPEELVILVSITRAFRYGGDEEVSGFRVAG